MDPPADDLLSRAITELGEPELVFRAGGTRLLTKFLLGTVLLLWGVVGNYYWWFRGPATFGHLELFLLIVLPVSGGVLLWHLYRERGLAVLLYDAGLLQLRRGEADSCLWAEVDHVLLRVKPWTQPVIERDEDGTLRACWLPVDIPWVQVWHPVISLVRSNGTRLVLRPVLGDLDRLAAAIQKRTFTLWWPRLWATFRDGYQLVFGDVEVSRVGIRLRNDGRFLPWAGFKEFNIVRGKLNIEQTGKWFPWAVVDCYSLPNPHMFVAVLTEGPKFATPSDQPEVPTGE